MDTKDQNYGYQGSELWIARIELRTTRIRIMDNMDQNYGYQGSELWTTRVRIMVSKDQDYGHQRSEFWTTTIPGCRNQNQAILCNVTCNPGDHIFTGSQPSACAINHLRTETQLHQNEN